MDAQDFIIVFLGCLCGFAIGVSVGDALTPEIHTEKHGCEYVEKTECKQVWVVK